MDDHSDRNHNVSPTPPPPPGQPPAVTVLAICPDKHPVAGPVAQSLRQAGCRVAESPNIYQAVVAVARDPTQYAAVALPVDYFNREELRFFPMAARRWPGLKTIALAQPAFAYKAAVAELAGAHLVCTDPHRADEVLALLGLGATGPQESAARETPTAAPQVPVVTLPEPPAPQQTEEQPVKPTGRPQPPQPPTVRRMPVPKPVAPPGAPLDVLTEEEIAALMADFDDQEPLPRNGTLDE